MVTVMDRTSATPRRGFTLIELLVVLSIVALLASIAAPRYIASLEQARETSLRASLAALRDAIDQHAADRGRYPESLAELVESRYLRALPTDPYTQRTDTWVGLAPAPESLIAGAMADVRSGAAGRSRDGSLYADW
jgi:general secretion pathway protein G